MVVHALHQVTHQFGVEERHREFKQFDEKVGNQRNIDSHTDMQQNPSADKVDRSATDGQHQLPQQDEVDKVQILMDDAHIYNRLREKWKDKLQQTAH